MIRYVKGDLLNATQLNIVHQVNCKGVMGAGVAKVIKERYPRAFKDYLNMLENFEHEDIMGEIVVTLVNNNSQRIIGIFAQKNYTPRNTKHTNYDALIQWFTYIRSRYTGDVAMPKIGCGLGGGDWKIVSAIIESVFNDRDVYIYEL